MRNNFCRLDQWISASWDDLLFMCFPCQPEMALLAPLHGPINNWGRFGIRDKNTPDTFQMSFRNHTHCNVVNQLETF